MKSAPSDAFRRLCLAMALLATTWAIPRPAQGDAYPLETVKNTVDALKPNVLVLLETAESMQGLAGENAARYNEVGADCEDGNRSCRLVNQSGRWSFSGMGSEGIKFGDPNSSCTATVTDTVTRTDTETLTDTATATATSAITNTNTNSQTTTVTNTNTNTNTNTKTTTTTQTNTKTSTATETVTNSKTDTVTSWFTNTNTNTNTNTVTTSNTNTITNTSTKTATGTTTQSITRTNTNSATATATGTNTRTNAQTGTDTYTATYTSVNTQNKTTTIEAENFGTKVGTGSNQAGPPVHYAMYTDGYIQQDWVWVDPGYVNWTITVRAKGASCPSGWPHFKAYAIRGDGSGSVFLGEATVSTTNWTDYNFSLSNPVGNNWHFQIAYDNDTNPSCSSGDRNLFVDYLRISGTALWPDAVTATETKTHTTTTTVTTTSSVTSTITNTWTATGTGTNTNTGTNTQTTTATGTSLGQADCSTPPNLFYEAESLARTFSQSVWNNPDPGPTGYPSGGSYVQFESTPGAVGSYIEFTLTGVAAGTYTVSYGYKAFSSRGIVQVKIDGANVGSPHDQYLADQDWTRVANAGNVTLTAGSHPIRFTTTGKNTNSSGYNIVVDAITLTGVPGNCTSTATATTTWTVTSSQTSTESSTETGTATTSSTSTETGLGTDTGTETGTGTATSTATHSDTTVSTSTGITTVTLTNSSTRTDTDTWTDTQTSVQVYGCGSEGSVDPTSCTSSVPTVRGFCNETSGMDCWDESRCQVTKGDFCRFISTSDGSGRGRNETCFVSSGDPWGSCKHGVVTANTSCNSSSDAACGNALAGDYCTEGQPAKMCADSGLWCLAASGLETSLDCPGGTEKCLGATSKMMTVKRALRRAVTDYADKVNFGFMNTYQGRGIPATATDASTAIYPYVRLQSCPVSNNMTETKFLTRGELEKAGCFDPVTGPASPCTIDYGGGGAINATASWNQITYSIAGGSDSRWLVPRGDGSGKFDSVSASWSTCATSPILPACAFGVGTGLYEGTYYSFNYKQGTPIPNGGVDGEGSRAHPVYFTTYRGKFYQEGTTCYNAIDTDRTDIVNDGIFGRPAYTGHPYSSANEVPVPWSGSNNPDTCGPTTGASWNSNVVPMLSSADTVTFGGQSLDRAERALMIAARLEKASFGGVYATGRVAPIGCALDNGGSSTPAHSAASYMSTVRANDTAANGSKAACWTNNIVLVVDGHSNGPGDLDQTATINCASTQCAYDSETNPTLSGCNCAAITKAYNLAQSGIKTHVVVNAPATWSARYPYINGFLVNLAIAGSAPDFDGTPAYGITEGEVYRAISEKIAAAAYPFVYTTTAPVPGATTQDPTTKLLDTSKLLFDTSVNYPTWQGNVRAFNTTPGLVWDAVTTAASGHPASWKARRIYFSDQYGAVHKVGINSSTGAISNKSTLYGAGLGSSADEAERIMQWVLGNPDLGNPAPLMGSITSSTPIVVGQANLTGQNGSEAYSVSTWKRPQLLYVGSDSGMLHAFFAPAAVISNTSGSFQIGSDTFQAGEEAFAFIPLDMMPVINKLYAQGGQNLAADRRIDGTTNSTKAHRNLLGGKNHHVFGLAGSPKVKDMCWGSGCTSSDGSGWHTVLVMTEGPGGNKPFVLDITDAVTEGGFNGLTEGGTGTGSLLWSAAVIDSSDGTHKWDKAMGETTSVPAFYYRPSLTSAPNRLLFASGYPTVARSTSGYTSQGLVLLDVNAVTGAWDTGSPHALGSTGASSCTSGARQQQRVIMADIALARDWTSVATSQNLLGAYVVDTWGNTYQYVPGMGTLTPALYTLGCGQPLYFSPAVVQLDKLQTGALSAQHQIYLVQVTNSNLDPDTRAYSSDYPGSQLVVTKLGWSGIASDAPVIDTMYNGSGKIVLSTDASEPENRICLDATNFTKTKADACGGLDGELPSTARPVGTPTVIMRSDGLGFQVITGWYDWTAHANNCTDNPGFNHGTSYVTVHEFGADGSWYQIAGFTLADTVLTGGTFVGTGFFLDGIMGANEGMPDALTLGQNIVSLQQIMNASGLERYSRTSWTERME
jgi:hypothetical protein